MIEALTLEIRRFITGVILFNEKVAAEVGLNGTDLQCLHLLQLHGAAVPSELAQWASVTTGGMTVVLDRLEKAGYITRAPNPKDRRSLIIRPAMARTRKLERIYRSKSQTLAQILSGLRQHELEVILSFFTKANASRGME